MTPAIVCFLLLALTIACAVLYYDNYSIKSNTQELAENMLQGYWRLKNDVYLLIDDSLFQIVDLSSGAPVEYFGSVDSTFQYKKSTPDSFSFAMTLSDNRNETSIFRLPNALTLDLYPVAGTIIVWNGPSEVLRATKDNEMTMVHFAS